MQIAGCADAAVVNLLDTGVTTLPDNFRGKINLVMRRPNARAQLRNHITGSNSKLLAHRRDRVPNDSEGRSLLAGMNQANCPGILVNQINRAAISYINPKADIPLIGNQPIAILETVVGVSRRVDNCNLISMNLPRRNKFSIIQAKNLPRLSVNLVEVFQDNRFVVRQLDSRNAPDEPVNTTGTLQRGECFDRQNATSQANSLPSWSSLRTHRRAEAVLA